MTTTPLLIRACRQEDLAAVVRLLDQLSLGLSREDTNPDRLNQYRLSFSDILADPRQTLLVAESGDQKGGIIGTVCVIVVPSLAYRGAPYAIVESMVIDAGVRGQKYGEQLLQHAVEIARDAGCRSVKLTSNKQRLDAHRFYLREGFVADHEGFTLDLTPIPKA